ncbi:hypothetical protein ACE2AJ_17575 [Aquihabitans daechungensis]|uniref:hypothetical protein n=1 Tax=Aquihabitans daechungensis TaxID=1052257 RepID=UPI003BA35467
MIELDAASFLLQWAVGGLFFTWVTTRRREVGLGYGWTMRITFGLMAASSILVSRFLDPVPVRDVAAVGVVLATAFALFVSVQRKEAGVAGQREVVERRSARVAAMTGIDRDEQRFDKAAAEFPPALDLVAPAIGVVGLIAAGMDAGSPAALSVARILVGAAFLGAITDAMLLGHWYLVQPGLARGPLLELVRWAQRIWPFEVLVMLIPASEGMLAVLNGTIDDDYGGILGWMWVTCAVTTLGLLLVTRAALKERQYSAVMAATGLLYLAILTAFGTDLVARAVLS